MEGMNHDFGGEINIAKGEKESREEGQHTCGAGTMEPSACRCASASEGLSARQRGVDKEEEAGEAGVAAKCFESTFLSSSRDAGITAHAGRKRGEDGEQEERGEEAEEQVVVREEEEDDNEE
jgi:hypothetical protein